MKVIYSLIVLFSLTATGQNLFDQARHEAKNGNPELAVSLLEQHVRAEVSLPKLATSYYALSYHYLYDLENFDKSLVCGFNALNYYSQLSDKDGMEKTLRHMGQIHLWAGNHEEVVNYSKLALEVTTDALRRAKNYHNLGVAYKVLQRFAASHESYFQSLSYYEAQDDHEKICELTIEIGLVYFYQKDFESAIEKYERAADYATHWQLPEWKARALNNIGNAHLYSGNRSKAIAFLSESLRIKRALKNDRLVMPTAFALAKLHYDIGDYPTANRYLNTAVASYSTYHDSEMYFDVLDLKHSTLLALNRADSAYTYLLAAHELSKQSQLYKERLVETQTSYLLKFREQQYENAKLQVRQERIQRERILYIIGGSLLALVGAWLVYRYITWRIAKRDGTGIVKFLPPSWRYRFSQLERERKELQITVRQQRDLDRQR